jgi:putative NIF3 family GTP cyclohydrolase 1 type 2
LDQYFGVAEFGPDPSMTRFVPMAYDTSGIDWRSVFEPRFCEIFNGLMLRGAGAVGTVYAAAFPSAEVVSSFLSRARPGDLLFVHHAVDLRNGNPVGSEARGIWIPEGKGVLPLSHDQLESLRDIQLSLYVCHAPLDVHHEIGTTRAIAEALEGTVDKSFFPYGPGHAGLLCRVAGRSTDRMERDLLQLFRIPYVERLGANRSSIAEVAVVAGVGDRLTEMQAAEASGAEAYVTGELRLRWDTERGRSNYAQIETYAKRTGMSLFGVSHAASEHLVMETQLPRWFGAMGLAVIPIRERQWWR